MMVFGVLKRRAVIIQNQKDKAKLLSKHYGRQDKRGSFKLHLAEAAYLQNKGHLKVINSSGKSIDLIKDIITNNKTLKKECAVYAKLRSEGYILNISAKKWYCQRENTKYLIKILDETSVLRWQQLFKIVTLAQKNKIEVMLAIVDKDGDITIEKLRFVEIK